MQIQVILNTAKKGKKIVSPQARNFFPSFFHLYVKSFDKFYAYNLLFRYFSPLSLSLEYIMSELLLR